MRTPSRANLEQTVRLMIRAAYAQGWRSDATLLHLFLEYDPEEGTILWRPHPSEMFDNLRLAKAWNTRFAGKEAFTSANLEGYKTGALLGVSVRAHRVIWAMQTGEWPTLPVDHQNGDRADNRWTNLRLATVSENNWNSVTRKDNTSGVKGVSWHKRQAKWRAQIMVNRRQISVGYFDHKDDAVRAVMAERAKRHGIFARDC